VQVFPPRVTDLGGMPVRRLVPTRGRRLVGPWCFLDLFGPVDFERDKPMDVAPHPHIGLQTVSWLLEGEALHKDSLDSEAVARPGSLNLMTAGAGIAHSVETPTEHSCRLHGIQLWLALPDAHRQGPPAFDHYPERPRVEEAGWRATVILGTLAGVTASGRTFSPLLGAEVTLDAGAPAALPLDPAFEHAVVPLSGAVAFEGAPLAADTLHYFEPGRDELPLWASEGGPARVLLIGGAPFEEPVLMWWNFVARTTEEIVAARDDWQARRRFGGVRRYAGERLEAPAFTGRPVPANPMS
jgi:redox-sensitive bicupin YhaK (pirin superfamily)